MFVLESQKILRRVCLLSKETVPTSKYRTKVDAGARRRLKLIEDANEINPEDLDYEADFSSVHQSHKQHINEMEMLREKLQYDIVKQKYFKTKLPNFLTWHDKEQIRLLHKKDPDEWTVTKLSRGFPALPEVIKKVIRAEWRMKSLNRVKNHDVAVQENWKKFKNNEFADLPVDLVEHLKKFSDRDLSFHNYEIKEGNKFDCEPPRKCTTFSDIITSYEKLKNKGSGENSIKINLDTTTRKGKQMVRDELDEDTYIEGNIKNKHLMTLDHLKNKLQKDVERGKQLSYVEGSIIEKCETVIDKNKPEKISAVTDQLDTVKYNTGKIMVLDDKKMKDYDHLVYPERIHIPKKY
ncbi:hypothetical protein HHI36_013368 [Cryptolaemus montrouzieri]|uniref:Neugrin n=1 Tax=Cryptolaemus montrouzieri TaxID=559131 RepID=A0ABD2NHY8_9CUCU